MSPVRSGSTFTSDELAKIKEEPYYFNVRTSRLARSATEQVIRKLLVVGSLDVTGVTFQPQSDEQLRCAVIQHPAEPDVSSEFCIIVKKIYFKVFL